MTDQPDDFTRRAYLYEGYRQGFRGDGDGHAQLRRSGVDGLDSDVMRFPWKAKHYRTMMPGHLYTIPTSADGRLLRFGEALHVKALGDDEARQAIIAAHSSNLAALDAKRQLAKLAKADINLDAILTPLLGPYAECRTFEAKAAFEVTILAALRRLGMGAR